MENEYFVEKIPYRGYNIEIYRDIYSENPIKNFDLLGTFTSFHRTYDLSCKKNKFTDKNEFIDFIRKNKNKIVLLPLRVYEHSGISISTSNNYPYNDRWDSSHVGYIWITYKTIREEYNVKHITKKLIEKVENILIDEVKLFDDYLNNNVYEYIIKSNNNDIVESCSGYYGNYENNNLLEDAKYSIDNIIKEKIKNRIKLVKSYIKNNVALIYRKNFILN